MKRKVLTYLLFCLLFAVGFALTFLAWAFVEWSFNPGNWDPRARFLIVLMGSLLGLALGLSAFWFFEEVEDGT